MEWCFSLNRRGLKQVTELSTKPYLIRAIHEWCIDNGHTPYLAVVVNQQTQVPQEFVKAGEIVLNTSPLATNKLQLGNEYVEFEARFGGVARQIMVPVSQISSIYSRENGHGLAFEVSAQAPAGEQFQPLLALKSEESDEKTPEKQDQKKKNHLTRVK